MKEDVHVRIDAGLMHSVRAYAEASGISLAAAVSVLLRVGLEESKP